MIKEKGPMNCLDSGWGKYGKGRKEEREEGN